MPPLALGAQAVVSASIFEMTFGIAALVVCWALLARLGVSGWIRSLTCLSLIPLLIRYAYAPLGPDLLIATIFLGVVFVLIGPRWSARAPSALVMVGLLAGLGYLAKGTAGLGVTLIAVFVAYTAQSLRERAPLLAHARRLALPLIAAGVLVVPWAIVLSNDLGRPTLGTAAAYSAAVVGPARQGEHPTTRDGFLAPPHARAVSAWEDPARLDVEPWSPADDPGYAAKRFVTNVARFGWAGLKSVPLAGLVAILALMTLRRERRHPAWVLAGFGLLLPFAYSPIIMQERYALVSYLLVVVLAAVGVTRFVHRRSLGARGAIVVLSAIVLSNAALAVKELGGDGLDTGAQEQRIAGALRDLPGTRLAADSHWHMSLAAAFRADKQFFGVPGRRHSVGAIRVSLDRMRVDGFLLWGPARPQPEYLREFIRGESLSVDGELLTIFRRADLT